MSLFLCEILTGLSLTKQPFRLRDGRGGLENRKNKVCCFCGWASLVWSWLLMCRCLFGIGWVKPKSKLLEMQYACIYPTSFNSSAHIEFPQLLELTQKLRVLEDSGFTQPILMVLCLLECCVVTSLCVSGLIRIRIAFYLLICLLQMYSTHPSVKDFVYSGSSHPSTPATAFQKQFVELVHKLVCRTGEGSPGMSAVDASVYTAVLQNWYEPKHTIGLHADDETVCVCCCFVYCGPIVHTPVLLCLLWTNRSHASIFGYTITTGPYSTA